MLNLINFNFINDHYEFMIESSTLYTYWKDLDGKYLGVNKAFSKYNHLKREAICGNTDVELGFAVPEVSCIRNNDMKVILTKRSKVITETVFCPKDNSIKKLLSYKTPLRTKKGKIIGVFGMSFDVEESQKSNEILKQMEFSHFFNSQHTEATNQSVIPRPQPEKLKLVREKLSKRELDCAYYLCRGMTAREIAIALNLSSRTVEAHLASMKHKLCVSRKSELIIKLLNLHNSLNLVER